MAAPGVCSPRGRFNELLFQYLADWRFCVWIMRTLPQYIARETEKYAETDPCLERPLTHMDPGYFNDHNRTLTGHESYLSSNDHNHYGDHPSSQGTRVDPLDEEANTPEDKYWAMYLKAARRENIARPRTWDGNTSGIITFTGLFANIVAAFAIESQRSLSPDSGDQTVQLLTKILAANTNASSTPSQTDTIPSFQAASTTVIYNAFWFSSLVVALVCALLATLIQQWSRDYVRDIHRRKTEHDTIRLRAFNHIYVRMGVNAYSMDQVVQWLVAFVHLSVILFFAGVLLFLYTVDSKVAFCTMSFIAFFGAVYLVASVLPLMHRSCPYRTPLTYILAFVYWVCLRLSGDWWTSLQELVFRHSGWHKGLRKPVEERFLRSSSKRFRFAWRYTSRHMFHGENFANLVRSTLPILEQVSRWRSILECLVHLSADPDLTEQLFKWSTGKCKDIFGKDIETDISALQLTCFLSLGRLSHEIEAVSRSASGAVIYSRPLQVYLNIIIAMAEGNLKPSETSQFTLMSRFCLFHARWFLIRLCDHAYTLGLPELSQKQSLELLRAFSDNADRDRVDADNGEAALRADENTNPSSTQQRGTERGLLDWLLDSLSRLRHSAVAKLDQVLADRSWRTDPRHHYPDVKMTVIAEGTNNDTGINDNMHNRRQDELASIGGVNLDESPHPGALLIMLSSKHYNRLDKLKTWFDPDIDTVLDWNKDMTSSLVPLHKHACCRSLDGDWHHVAACNALTMIAHLMQASANDQDMVLNEQILTRFDRLLSRESVLLCWDTVFPIHMGAQNEPSKEFLSILRHAGLKTWYDGSDPEFKTCPPSKEGRLRFLARHLKVRPGTKETFTLLDVLRRLARRVSFKEPSHLVRESQGPSSGPSPPSEPSASPRPLTERRDAPHFDERPRATEAISRTSTPRSQGRLSRVSSTATLRSVSVEPSSIERWVPDQRETLDSGRSMADRLMEGMRSDGTRSRRTSAISRGGMILAADVPAQELRSVGDRRGHREVADTTTSQPPQARAGPTTERQVSSGYDGNVGENVGADADAGEHASDDAGLEVEEGPALDVSQSTATKSRRLSVVKEGGPETSSESEVRAE